MRRVLGFLVAVAVVAGAYLYGAHRATTSSTTTPSSSVSTTSQPATTSTSTTATTTTTTVPLTACTGGALTGASSFGGGAAGTIELDVVLTNTGASPCALRGYASLLLRNASGQALPTSRILGGGGFIDAAANRPPLTVALNVGQSATVALRYSDVSTGSANQCPTAQTIEITVPGASTAVPVAATLAPCGGRLTVSPFYRPGA